MSEATNLLTKEGAINPEAVRRVSLNIKAKRFDEVRSICKGLHYVDFADLIENLPPVYRYRIVEIVGDEFDPRVWMELNETVRDNIAVKLDSSFITHQIAQMDSHDALFLLHHLPEEERQIILEDDEVPEWEKKEIEESLLYKEDTAGHVMHHDIVRASPDWNVGQLRKHIHDEKDKLPKRYLEVYVVDENKKPVGSILLSKIASADDDMKLIDMIDDRPVFIPVDMESKEVAFRFRKYHLFSAGVTNEIGELVGRITSEDMVGIIAEGAEKEAKQLAGVGGDSIFNGIVPATRNRFKWLFVNLLTAIIASSVISFFDGTIEQFVALAVLMPIVASMGGVAGTQTLTIAVRAIATHELRSSNQASVIYRELAIGILNGLGFALLIGAAGGFYSNSIGTGIILAGSLVITMIVAALSGVMIPVFIDKFGADPALSSGVFVTTVTDVVGFMTFLGTATLFLSYLL
jgi:magnesium transporter